MTDSLTTTLLTILMADSLNETIALVMNAFCGYLNTPAACLLLWDSDLHRYTVGETQIGDGYTVMDAAGLRRTALRAANRAVLEDCESGRCLEPALYYQPLNHHDDHCAAVVCQLDGVQPDPTDSDYAALLKASARALATNTRLQQARREHAELEADRARLEQLLQAVEQQQRTIDRLLATERQFSAQLEAKVEERTAALKAAQDRLLQSEKLAVIGQLAASLAHELNNPMQAIQSGLGLVISELESGSSDYVREDLAMIQTELERIESIFRQMLDFHRPVTHDYLPLDINAICEGMRVLLRKKLQETHITLHLELADSLPVVCGDGNQIKQVLLNLLLNAAEAMPADGGVIRVQTAAEGDWVLLRVHDDGAGVAPEHMTQLFEPLFTTKTRGLGLGLAISREIIERHYGQITVVSAPESGTTFTVSLPIRGDCDGQGDDSGRG